MTTSSVSCFSAAAAAAAAADFFTYIGSGIRDVFFALIDAVSCCSRSALGDVGETFENVNGAQAKPIRANVAVDTISVDYSRFGHEKADRLLKQIALEYARAQQPPTSQEQRNSRKQVPGSLRTTQRLLAELVRRECGQDTALEYNNEAGRLASATLSEINPKKQGRR